MSEQDEAPDLVRLIDQRLQPLEAFHEQLMRGELGEQLRDMLPPLYAHQTEQPQIEQPAPAAIDTGAIEALTERLGRLEARLNSLGRLLVAIARHTGYEIPTTQTQAVPIVQAPEQPS